MSFPNSRSSRAFDFARILALLGVVIAALSFAAPGAEAAKKQRIVALTPFTANTLAKLDSVPIAIGQTLDEEKKRMHKKLKGVRVLTLSHPYGPNLEEIASLNPDIVFTSSTWKKGTPAMRQLGIKVIESDPTSIGAVYSQTKRIARLVGRKAQGSAMVDSMKKSVRAATRNIDERPRVMVILGVGKTPFVFLANSWGGRIVKQAGGQLITQGYTAPGGFARISDEVVLDADPEIIIAVPHASEDDYGEVGELLAANETWKATQAGQSGRIYLSWNNMLLQADTDIGRTIKRLRKEFLLNW